MKQVSLILTLDDLAALANGLGIVYTSSDGQSEITVTCDSATLGAFRKTINLALMQHLPAAPGTH